MTISALEQEQLVDLAVNRLVDQAVIFNEQALVEAAAQLGLPVDTINDQRVLELLDMQVFWCDRCGWCCSTEELHNEDDDEHCEDCDD